MKLLAILFLALFCTTCTISNIDGARILGIFALQGKSHFLMFEALMKSLADAGHQVDVVGHFPLKKPYKRYTDISLAGTLPPVLNNITYEVMESLRSSSFKNLIDMGGTGICRLLEIPQFQKLIKNPPNDPPYDLLITEYFYSSCFFAFGRHLKVPTIAVSSASLLPHSNEPLGNPLNTAIVSEISERPAFGMNFFERLKNTLAVFYMNTQVRYYLKEQTDIVRKNFGPAMPNVEELENDISLLLLNSHYIFHGVRPLVPAIVEVSGMHLHEDNTPVPEDLMKWMNDSEDGFFYFSLGSMVMLESFPKQILAEFYEAFNKIAPTRVLVKVGQPDKLPSGLPKNVITQNWVPQVQVLKHKNIRGFITHGGLMGLQETVKYAVPFIGIPLFGDQMGNIKICVDREIALSLDYKDMKADKLVDAMKALVQDPKYKKNINAISKKFLDRPTDTRKTAVFWVEYILKHGKDALRSPAVHLTWWQLALLDVYGVIIAAILILIYIIKLFISLIIGQILNGKKKLPSSNKKKN